MKYKDRLSKISSDQKNGDFYYNNLTKHISAPLTSILSYTPLTPNMATLTMFFFGLSGAFFFSYGTPYGYLYGGTSFVLLILADTVDGELARFQEKSSLFGDYFDRLAHYTTNPLLFLGLGIGLYSNFGSIIYIYLSSLAMIFYLLDDLSRDLVITSGLSKIKNRKEQKEKMSITNNSHLRKFLSNTGSNTAFFHIIIFSALIDIILLQYFYANTNLLVSHFYIGYFMLLTVGKFFFRIPKIWSLKNI